jgi:fumarate reductase subunit D
MLDPGRQDEPERGERRVIWMEFVAATSILAIIALVLFMIFTYQAA